MQTIRSIVVHLDATPRSEVRLRIALALAHEAQAQLTGLYAVTPTAYALPLAMPEDIAMFSPALEQLERERRERARGLFERVAGAVATVASCWEDASGSPSWTAVAARALSADLLVFGQHDETQPELATEGELAASALIESGTPGLVIPHSGTFAAESLARPNLTVLLAWKPTREAARAARAALPWLRRAKQVHIAVESAPARVPPWPGAAPLRAWLQLHGVGGELHDHALGHANPGEMLLSMAADVSADLLVMGCFGHSRARELVLGGASRTVLGSMTFPTLMAH